MRIYCVYLTTYLGNKLPMFYIGSSTVTKVESGYHGSVKSANYKQTWKSELTTNPHLFKTKIIATFDTREEATACEYRLQKALGVVRSPMYINMALAAKYGFFGRDTSGENNPFFGKSHTAETVSRLKSTHSGTSHPRYGKPQSRTERLKRSISLRENNPMRGRTHTEATRTQMSTSRSGEKNYWYGKTGESAPFYGVKQTEDQIRKRADSCARQWSVKHPDGTETIEHNMSRFCRDHSLDPSSMSAVAKGRKKQHKGFKCVILGEK